MNQMMNMVQTKMHTNSYDKEIKNEQREESS